jgi:hypothetical protein
MNKYIMNEGDFNIDINGNVVPVAFSYRNAMAAIYDKMMEAQFKPKKRNPINTRKFNELLGLSHG